MSEHQQKSWFGRNWGWVVPVGGCGCGCIGLILLFVFGIGAAFFGISEIITNATPVEHAIKQAEKNEKVRSFLGEPIEKNGIPSGNISINNDEGDVDFSIPISGPNGKGTLIVRGIRTNGEWIYEDLYVRIKETQEEINLLAQEKVLENI
ncbi:cytochrome c oxidase assembly factor Coa1 family protein [Tenacibaculum soleae]|uniref:cytochrome c oxidase assembly factor Coa1 family protein n=1 Tax=Tenacibaculum soleae TaxID=447689 RepID=UPI002301748B|nr:cytochrome c oxidase assembly factor Coa1 family protein [Tenacibaculum soleae]